MFFTEQEPDGETWIRAVGEYGDVPYVVAGKTAPPYAFPNDDNAPPDPLKTSFLGLIAFHPDGAHLYVRAANGCADTLNYRSGWRDMNTAKADCSLIESTTQFNPTSGSDTLDRLPGVSGKQAFEIAPSGLTALEWSPGIAGVAAYDLNDHSRTMLATSSTFLAAPRVTADGRGLVGITGESGSWILRDVPIVLPLADVADAWAFLGPADVKNYAARRHHLASDGGFLIDSGDDQINTLYDSEQSACGGAEVPLRPLMITTDAMWEVYGAADEGLFGMVERERVLGRGLSAAGWRIRGFTRPDGTLGLEGRKPGQRTWHNQGPTRLLEAEAGQFAPHQPQRLLLLQRVYSRLDGTNDPRPYVYDIQDDGLRAIWRGTALGWPLRDAIIVQAKPDILCALHRDDNFLVLNSTAPATRIEAWRWNGFGFTRAQAQRSQCAGLW